MKWRDSIDPGSIPLDVLRAEIGRRGNRSRKTRGAGTGRPPVLTPCAFCGKPFSARDMRRHVPACPKKMKAKAAGR